MSIKKFKKVQYYRKVIISDLTLEEMGKQIGKGKRKQGKRKQIGGYVSSWGFKKQRGKGTKQLGGKNLKAYKEWFKKQKRKQKGGRHRGRHRSRR